MRAVHGLVRFRHWRQAHPRQGFLVSRLVRLAISVVLLVTLTFGIIHAVPGDPVRGALGMQASAEVVQAQREANGLNDPIWRQYVDYGVGVAQGDFGTSLISQLSVRDTVSQRFSATITLALSAFVASLVLSLLLGTVMAVLTRNGSRRRSELFFAGTTGLLGAIPEFVMAVGLVFVFSVVLRWFPVAGMDGPASYVLPVLALALAPAAALSRIVRVEMIKVLSQDYMRTARSKRLPPLLTLVRHAMPNMLTSVLTIGGLLLTGLVAGSVLVETVFAWPGMGTLAVDSIIGKDYPMVQAVVLISGLLVLGVNLLVDLLIGFLQPQSIIKES